MENEEEKVGGVSVDELREKAFKESKLNNRVKDLVNLIFDLKMMNNAMKQIGYDPKKMPLGRFHFFKF